LRYASNPIEPAALVNLALLLLLIYVYASSYVIKQPGIRLSLPIIENPDPLPYSSLVLTISRDSLLFFNDERVSLDELRTVMTRAVFDKSSNQLVIEADEFVQTATLMKVSDIARDSGIRDIHLAGRLPRGAPVIPSLRSRPPP
jgi:biopolymer transport protein ExbD